MMLHHAFTLLRALAYLILGFTLPFLIYALVFNWFNPTQTVALPNLWLVAFGLIVLAVDLGSRTLKRRTIVSAGAQDTRRATLP